jgi:cupin 2 domain-containing protein
VALSNILQDIPQRLDDEQFLELLIAPGLKIERIVSLGHTTPAGRWLVQSASEWVLLVQGQATLRLDGVAELSRMRPGDHLHIPARLRHRVEATSVDPPTVWLAVHYGAV